jgi:exonuclease III
MVANEIKDKIKGAEILNDVVHSDHCPISLLIER